MDADAVLLSRLQFAWVIAWHILLPAFTVGLASYIAFLEGAHFITGRAVWLRLSKFWLRIFAISFGLGVVTGVVMPFQFGTNWSRFSDATANVVAPLLAYEGLTAFFLEAAFLGVLMFGRKLVPPSMHFFSALMVAAGTLFSSFWILAVNSWMQTPTGYEIVDGRFFPTSWTAIIFNPSFPYRLAHTVSAFYVTTAFVVLGVGAYILRRGRAPEDGRLMMLMAGIFLTIFVPLQIVLGDLHGLNTRDHQPAKLAAMEALWDTQSPAPFTVFAIPEQSAARNRAAIEIPYAGSLILTHELNGVVRGLKEFPADDRPPVAVVFFAFRIMIAIGFAMLAVVLCFWWLRSRGRAFTTVWFLRLCQWFMPAGFLAVLAGWTVTEVGRQPWTVYGLLRTADSVSPSLTATDVAISLAFYMIVYLIVFPAALLYIVHIVHEGPAPDGTAEEDGPIGSGRPTLPIEALPMREGGQP
jgi:cytochrome bd ubiquinol oxidase subunit I